MANTPEHAAASADGRDSPAPNDRPSGVQPVERVRMIRADLDELPQWPLPPGFRLRAYRSGDQARWQRIITATERHLPISPEQHVRTFGSNEREIARRQLFLADPDGLDVGTATAWLGSEPFSLEWGRIHWLAVLPDWQGCGLGKALLAATLQRLSELGHRRAYLVTESVRRRAIQLYLKAGFAPDIRTPAEAVIWRGVLEA